MEEYNKIFDQLWQHAESEIVEFKKAESNFDFDELGRYFSALSNEANLRERDFAWLVFGVHDKTHTIIGTSYKDGEVALKIDNDKRSVGVTIYGKVIDENYTNLLKSDTFLSLKECVWLDAVQKNNPITKDALQYLKSKGLIEKRGTKYTISLKVAQMTHQIGRYTKEQGLAYDVLVKLALQLAHNAGHSGFKRKDAYETLQHSLPASSPESKMRYIGRLLVRMKDNGQLITLPSGKAWIITEKGENDLKS